MLYLTSIQRLFVCEIKECPTDHHLFRLKPPFFHRIDSYLVFAQAVNSTEARAARGKKGRGHRRNKLDKLFRFQDRKQKSFKSPKVVWHVCRQLFWIS